MITTPSTDYVLDDKHAKQLEVGLQKLSNVEAEVSIANRNLRVLKDDIVKGTLELKELEDKLVKLNILVSEKQTEKENIDALLSETTGVVDKIKQEVAVLEDRIVSKEVGLSEREEAIKASELEAQLATEELRAERVAFEEEKKQVESAKEALRQASLTITWK